MRVLWRWIVDLLTKNVGWKLLSVLVAVILWALVASEPELSTFTTVQLEYKNLPEDLEIASEPVARVSLELRGSAAVLSALNESGNRPSVLLDMSNILPGETTFSINDGNVKLTRGVSLVRAQPSQVRFTFERRMTRRIPVVVRYAGGRANGYVVASQTVDPDALTVVGPASHVARITGVSTDPVDVSGVVGTSQFRVNAYVDDPYVRFQSDPRVAVTVTMRKQ